jgi:hypothetical protein
LKPGVDQADLWEDLEIMRLLICGGRHFDNAVLVDTELSRINVKTPISVMIHGGLPGIGFPAEAWARRNSVHVIRYPANFSLGKNGDFMRDLFMLEDSRPDAMLMFPGGRRTAEILLAARAGKISVTEVWAIDQGLVAGLRLRPLPVDREGDLLAV